MNTIHNYYYNEELGLLFIEFSTEDDGDDFYRELKLDYAAIEYYSPTIIDEYDLHDIDDDFVLELISQYLIDNDLPEQKNL